MASLDMAFQESNLSQQPVHEPPRLINQAMPQFEIQYPFWSQNMRTLLMIRQQSPDGDKYMKYSMQHNGLKNSETRECEPFYVLCSHPRAMKTHNGSSICGHCGWFMMKTQSDQNILEANCKHPAHYCIINHAKQLQRCGQCGKVIKLDIQNRL